MYYLRFSFKPPRAFAVAKRGVTGVGHCWVDYVVLGHSFQCSACRGNRIQFTSSTRCSALNNRVMIVGLGCSVGFQSSFFFRREFGFTNWYRICIISESLAVWLPLCWLKLMENSETQVHASRGFDAPFISLNCWIFAILNLKWEFSCMRSPKKKARFYLFTNLALLIL